MEFQIKRASLALIVLVTCSTAHAQDQAISACESIIKAELIAPKSYESVSRVAIGNVVQITYDAANKFNAPLRATERCEFNKTTSGWVLSEAYSENAMKSELSAVISNFKSGNITREEGLSKSQEIERRYSSIVLNDANRALNAQSAGPYPIPPHMTELR